jgi:hypothetical protein
MANKKKTTAQAFTAKQLEGFAHALELALDDQENYFDSGNLTSDYSPEDLKSKADAFNNCADAAFAIGQLHLADRFRDLSQQILALALSESSDLCECGREERDCAVSVGADVHLDRDTYEARN